MPAPSQLLLAAAIVASAVALRVADPDPIARLRHSVFDTYLRLAPRTPDPAFPVRIVDVDEASLQRIGQWPWPRTVLAKIVDNLREAGVKTIAVDLILSEPDRLSPAELARQLARTPGAETIIPQLSALPSNDGVLADAARNAPLIAGVAGDAGVAHQPPPPRARFAIAGDDPKLFVGAFAGGVGSIPSLAEAAKGQGAVNWLPDRDQIVRRVPTLLNIGGVLYPSLPVEALRVGANDTSLFVRSSGGSGTLSFGQRTGIDTVRVGGVVLPTDADGQVWLHFAKSDPHRYISAHRILEGTFDSSEVAGRHIFIGASATGLLDLRATPLEASVPGVEIHALALEQMLSGEHLIRPAYATGAELMFLVAAGFAVAAMIRRSGPLAAALAGATSIFVVSVGSWVGFTSNGYLFDPVYPSLTLLAVYLSGSLSSYVKTESDRARVKSAFSHYVAAPLVDELARNHDKLKLGGEMRDVTLLFADVRGFSKISEGMDAEALIRFVNAIFTPLSEIILQKRGTIDKFMGDAVMAFWNAPVADPEHAVNACRAALAMMAALDRLNREREAVAAAAGETAAPVRIGIGLNTGSCCVGNVGSPERFDYSILGDPVNVASRLEEMTKTFGVPIIAGERTAREAASFGFLEIGEAALRGKARPEKIFALVGDETLASSDAFRRLRDLHSALTAALRANDLQTAARELGELRAMDWPGLEPLVTYYGTRLAET